MSSPYRQEILDQLLDGKRIWSLSECDGDRDVFYTRVVVPLRELRYEGIYDRVNEIEFPINGDVVIAGVEIIGGVNYHAAE